MKSSVSMQTWLVMSIIAVMVGGLAWASDGVAATGTIQAQVAAVYPKDVIVITGTVTQVEAEGSFWGVVTDDGKQYEVTNLPNEFKKQGLRVKVVGKEQPDQFSIHMWGARVDALSVVKIEE